jgi:hypothetical protein
MQHQRLALAPRFAPLASVLEVMALRTAIARIIQTDPIKSPRFTYKMLLLLTL